MTWADAAPNLLIGLREAHIGLAGMNLSKPSLDEVFLTLTGHDAADQNDTDDESEVA